MFFFILHLPSNLCQKVKGFVSIVTSGSFVYIKNWQADPIFCLKLHWIMSLQFRCLWELTCPPNFVTKGLFWVCLPEIEKLMQLPSVKSKRIICPNIAGWLMSRWGTHTRFVAFSKMILVFLGRRVSLSSGRSPCKCCRVPQRSLISFPCRWHRFVCCNGLTTLFLFLGWQWFLFRLKWDLPRPLP